MGRFTAAFIGLLAAAAVTTGLTIVLSGQAEADWAWLAEGFLIVAFGFIYLCERHGLVKDPYRDPKDRHLTLK